MLWAMNENLILIQKGSQKLDKRWKVRDDDDWYRPSSMKGGFPVAISTTVQPNKNKNVLIRTINRRLNFQTILMGRRKNLAGV